MNCRTNNAEQTSFVIFIATIGFGIGFITFKEEGAGSEARRRPLPALPSRRGFFLDLLTSRGGDCAIAGVLRLRVEGPRLAARRTPPSSSSEEEETTTTGGRFPIGIDGRAGGRTNPSGLLRCSGWGLGGCQENEVEGLWRPSDPERVGHFQPKIVTGWRTGPAHFHCSVYRL
jgi:hypothetical protein